MNDQVKLDELNQKVTQAIYDSERGPSYEGYLRVSRLEAEIATLTRPESIEGAVARVGAVRAAFRAQDALRAHELFCKYLAEVTGRQTPWADDLRRGLRSVVVDTDPWRAPQEIYEITEVCHDDIPLPVPPTGRWVWMLVDHRVIPDGTHRHMSILWVATECLKCGKHPDACECLPQKATR